MKHNRLESEYESADPPMREDSSYQMEAIGNSRLDKKAIIRKELQDILDKMAESHGDADNADYINKIKSTITNLDKNTVTNINIKTSSLLIR